MLCFNQSLITAQCPAQTINNWRSVLHYLLSLSLDSTIALRFATLWNWYHCTPVLIKPIPRRQWKGQLHWWYTISQSCKIDWQNHFQSQMICISFAMHFYLMHIPISGEIWPKIWPISQHLARNGILYSQVLIHWQRHTSTLC